MSLQEEHDSTDNAIMGMKDVLNYTYSIIVFIALKKVNMTSQQSVSLCIIVFFV